MIRIAALLALLPLLWVATPARACLLRLEVQEVVSPAFEGRVFGGVGAMLFTLRFGWRR